MRSRSRVVPYRSRSNYYYFFFPPSSGRVVEHFVIFFFVITLGVRRTNDVRFICVFHRVRSVVACRKNDRSHRDRPPIFDRYTTSAVPCRNRGSRGRTAFTTRDRTPRLVVQKQPEPRRCAGGSASAGPRRRHRRPLPSPVQHDDAVRRWRSRFSRS